MKKRLLLTLSTLITVSSLVSLDSCVKTSETSMVKNTFSTSKSFTTNLKGKVEFPSPNPLYKGGLVGLKTKATLQEIAVGATVSLIYPQDHPTSPNTTIAVGLTNSVGLFTINPDPSFQPQAGEVFVLEASKRLGGTGNNAIALRTHLQWNGSSWDAITTNGIYINTKTTALSIISNLNTANLPAASTIKKMPIVNDVTQITGIDATFTENLINIIKDTVDQALTNNLDPVATISLSNNQYVFQGTPILPITVDELLFSQIHVLPPQGLTWTVNNKVNNYYLTGERDALAMVAFKETNLNNPMMEVWLNGSLQATIPLQAPANFPNTEANGSKFRTQSYTALIPAKWMKRGLALKFAQTNRQTTSLVTGLEITNNASVTLESLPFYLYGAYSGGNGSPLLSQTQLPSLPVQTEVYEKWPVAKLKIQTHPAGFIQWPYMVISPRSGSAAYRANNKDEQKEGYATMSSVLSTLSAIRQANGDENINKVHYAPLVMWNAAGNYSSPGGGLGGSHRGTGEPDFAGTFIHEMGHGFGLPHQGDAYTAGTYPYAGGSLLGSVWGYNLTHNEFLPPFIPSTHSLYNNCNGVRQKDAQGLCIKQDPMQGGNGDKDPSYFYATFSDYSTSQMQTDINTMIFEDPSFPSGYSKWDSVNKVRVEVPIATVSKGIFGLDNSLPITKNVNVHTIVITYSNVPCAPAGVGNCNSVGVNTEVSQIYPPLSYIGNLRRVINPTVQSDLNSIIPDTSINPWYCRNGGCDYTVRVTYNDDSTWHTLIQNGFRPFNQATGTPSASTLDPLNGASFKVWGVNAPRDKPIKKIELLETPMVWNGFPVNPKVIISR